MVASDDRLHNRAVHTLGLLRFLTMLQFVCDLAFEELGFVKRAAFSGVGGVFWLSELGNARTR